MKYIVKGGKKLLGTINISGNKNSVFPCVAAALLTKDEVILENIPENEDTKSLIEILKNIGVNVSFKKNTLSIKATKISSSLPKELMVKLRGSIVLVGAILARNGAVSFYHPGGDVIGKRGINAHLEGFHALGADYIINDLSYRVSFKKKRKIESRLNVFLPERSVTATENLILASSIREGRTILRNCASEPHVVDLCQMIISMGGKILGVGTDTLEITGSKLRGAKFRIRADYIEIGTYGVAAAVTKGKITLNGLDDTDLDPILLPLMKFNINYTYEDQTITFQADNIKANLELTTNVWPGFPTDLMSVFIVLATQASGVTLCHDWMFESRMFFADKLMSMGANITIADPHRVFVYGNTLLKARELETPDIRAGMALVLASLVADGESIINKAELIERGYEDVVEKLRSLGADIKRLY